jgi:hypothetical protein
MDCLDRTNSVQSFIGIEMLKYQLSKYVRNETELNKFRDVYRQMWIINGNNISKIYAGTDAIQGKSKAHDFTRSLSRAIQNNFLDSAKQNIIETFLYSMSRNYDELFAERVRVLMSQSFLRLPYPVLRELVHEQDKYTEKTKCRISIGTYNINGGLKSYDMKNLDLNEWLLMEGPLQARRTGLGYLHPSMLEGNDILQDEIDIFAVGFEEIVDLSAQNIMNASEENANEWRKKIQELIGNDYVELIAENLQLVGVCLFVFVHRKHVGAIRDVYIAKTKTGLGGAAGNKGAVLLRFVYYNTSMCFVCAHFAAHQKEIRQRNEDFRQIYEQSEFSRKKDLMVAYHDYVFWLGDLNYRIDLPNEICRPKIAEENWEYLLKYEQLTLQKREQNVFKEFNEAEIEFPPTYKYNLNADAYDSSEKCRVPAWTDRILWRRRPDSGSTNEGSPTGSGSKNNFSGNAGKCLYYGRADIRLSDHRPVSALFDIEVDRVVPKRLIETLKNVLVMSHGAFQVTLMVKTNTNYMDANIRDKILILLRRFKSFGTFRYFIQIRLR